MTVQSYNGNLDFGFIACRELVPDVWLLADLLQESMQELLESATPPATPRRRRTPPPARPRRARPRDER